MGVRFGCTVKFYMMNISDSVPAQLSMLVKIRSTHLAIANTAGCEYFIVKTTMKTIKSKVLYTVTIVDVSLV